MQKHYPAIHHNSSKLCTISFRNNGQFVSLKNQRFNNRGDAFRYVRASYPSAINISIVFFVPKSDTLPRVSRTNTYCIHGAPSGSCSASQCETEEESK